MNNLNICVDIDGTITDPYYWVSFANDYFGLNICNEDVTCYDIAKVLNVTREEYLNFYEKKKYEIHIKQKLRSDVKDVIETLYMYNNIYYVTARDKSLEMLTKIYLKSHYMPSDEVIVLGNANKVPTAKKLNCDIFIEDSYANSLDLSENGFKVLLLDTNYNRLPLNENITRVKDWHEILEIIENIPDEISEAAY